MIRSSTSIRSSIEPLEPRRLLTTLAVTATGAQWGNSTQNIGAVEGNVRFNISDMTNLGINTYRIYGGMSRWERTDDDGVYGSPSIAQIEADPNVVNWSAWDTVMTTPPGGSDYTWALPSGNAPVNARTIFAQLKAAGIRPVVTLRNVDDQQNPSWAPNPVTTDADKNEWWEHVFATVYWMNVRNDYRVDDWEVHNEPNISSQGWGGTQAQYMDFVKITSDAIRYVYQTYLPGRTPHIFAPVSTPGSTWPQAALAQVPSYFDNVDIHDYDGDITSYVKQVHTWMNTAGQSDREVWLSEWGTYRASYDTSSMAISVVRNLIRGSRPGDDHLDGSHVFALYDWGSTKGKGFAGVIRGDGTKTKTFYAMRLALRALQGGKETHYCTRDNNVTPIATKDAQGNTYLVIANGSKSSYTINADLSQLITSGTGTMWEFDSTHNDTTVGSPVLNNGRFTFNMPGLSAFLVKFPPVAPVIVVAPTIIPTPPPTSSGSSVLPTDPPPASLPTDPPITTTTSTTKYVLSH